MKHFIKDSFGPIPGILLLAGGLVLIRLFPASRGILRTLPYVCIGLGCGLFGHGLDRALYKKAMAKSPELQKRIEIEQKDERNQAIVNRAKAKAYDRMELIYGALLLVLALMGAETPVVLLLVSAYLCVIFCAAYYRFRYEKEM